MSRSRSSDRIDPYYVRDGLSYMLSAIGFMRAWITEPINRNVYRAHAHNQIRLVQLQFLLARDRA